MLYIHILSCMLYIHILWTIMHPLYDCNENIQKIWVLIFLFFCILPLDLFLLADITIVPRSRYFCKFECMQEVANLCMEKMDPMQPEVNILISKKKFFQRSSSSLDEISTLWGSHYMQDPLNNDNIQLTSPGFVPSIGPLWENVHNTNYKNFIFIYLIVSLN